MRWVCWCLFAAAAAAPTAERPLIFPEPQKMTVLAEDFRLDEQVPIVVPEAAAAAELATARELAAELSDRYGLGLRLATRAALPAGRYILMGSTKNPLVRAALAAHRVAGPPAKAEAYSLRVGVDAAVVAGNDEDGAFYGMQSLRQLLRKQNGGVAIRGMEVGDWPHVPFRGVRLYLPGHDNIAFFRRFLRDFMALYKFNKVILEVNGSMRLDRHPEVNAGWIDFAKDLYYTQRYFPLGPKGAEQNSAHHDTADGEILEKDEVADLARFAASQHIEVIPEIPTFTHAYYLLTRHKDLGAITGAEWPDLYDPTKPEIYNLVFDVMDEYIGVLHPKMIDIGHDEMFFPVELCPSCEKRDPALLYADDIRRIHDHLAAQGIRTAIYGDHLVESVRGVHRRPAKSTTGWEYTMPGALTPQQVMDLIPKDILILNWFWQDARKDVGRGEPNDVKLSEFGFEQVHANFASTIENYARRTARKGVIGGAPSAWAATTEYTFGKDLMMDFLGTANLMWSTHWPTDEALSKIVQSMMPDVRRRLSGRALPSENGDPVHPIPFQAPTAVAVQGKKMPSEPLVSAPIPVGADVSSIIFLHACAKPAANDMSYRYIHNFPDTADLLGWYEVVYEDGYTESVPVRYGWNILPLAWGAKPDVIMKGSAKELSYAYAADAVPRGGETFFAYEWVNPRFGKVIKEIRLHGTSGFVDSRGNVTPDNSIVLAGISVVPKRQPPAMQGAK